MKSISLFLFFMAGSASAQSIVMSSLSKASICVGDTAVINYTPSGLYKSDNQFIAQLSDPTGSFGTFTTIGIDCEAKGSFNVQLNRAGLLWRLRVISSDPYVVSSDSGVNIAVN